MTEDLREAILKIEIIEKILEEKLNNIGKGIEELKKSVEEMKEDVGTNKTNILVGSKEAKEERTVIQTRINETYSISCSPADFYLEERKSGCG